VLIHLRGKVVRNKQDTGGAIRKAKAKLDPENVAMQALAKTFSDPRLYEASQRAALIGQWPLARSGAIHSLPGRLAGWTSARDLKPVPEQSFRRWWRENRGVGS
jgi:L-lactate dehydrogenase complex protein LldF